MAIDRTKLPPQILAVVELLEKAGVTVEPVSLTEALKASQDSSTPSDDDVCPCPVCARRRVKAAQDGASGKTVVDAIPPNVKAGLDVMTDALVERLTQCVKAHFDPLHVAITAQAEINEATLRDFADLNGLASQHDSRIEALFARQGASENNLLALISDLDERFRKQTSLLHKRVTKRKGEVAVVRGRVASTRGRLTKAEKLAGTKI